MPEIPMPEDQATLYVLGELTARERCEFEERMAQSVELRALVRELEEGGVALTTASPRRQAPQGVWKRIERSVAAQQKWKIVIPAFWINWWRHGWAAAAACLVGWLFYALWVNRSYTSVALLSPAVSTTNSHPEATAQISERAKTETAIRQARAETDAILRAFQSKTQEIGTLRSQILQLTNRVAQLSHDVVQQQGILAEPDRLKFFQLTQPNGDGTFPTGATVSTNLQWALFLAMAGELGWLPSMGTNGLPNSFWTTNHPTIDFVDLRSDGNDTANPAGQWPPELNEIAADSPVIASTSSNAIPGFVSGTSVFVAVDSSLVASGSSLGFGTMTSDGFQSFGQVPFTGNPTVIAFPSTLFSDGWNLTVTGAGASNVIQFWTLGNPQP